MSRRSSCFWQLRAAAARGWRCNSSPLPCNFLCVLSRPLSVSGDRGTTGNGLWFHSRFREYNSSLVSSDSCLFGIDQVLAPAIETVLGTFGDELLMRHKTHPVLLCKPSGTVADKDIRRYASQRQGGVASIVDKTG